MKSPSFRVFFLLMGFFVVLTACSDAANLQPQILGMWEFTDSASGETVKFEFQEDGKLMITGAGKQLDAIYTCENGNTIKIEFLVDNQMKESWLSVDIANDELTLTIDGVSEKLKRPE